MPKTIFTRDLNRSNFTRQLPDYSNTFCPVLERLHEKELVNHDFMVPSMKTADMDDVAAAFEKVWAARHRLKSQS